MSKVSVIIPTYNCAEYLPQAIESVIGQTFNDYEVIIIDDGSLDNTKNIIIEYAGRYSGRIRYFYQANQGQAIARNVGIRESKGEYIALLDADDIWLSDRLEEGVKLLDNLPSVGLVHSNVTKISENGEPVEIPNRKTKFLSGHIFEHLLLQTAHISSPTVLFRKECCDRVGLFDENLRKLGSEDRDLWIRIAKQYEIKYIDKVLAYYRMRPASASRDRQKMLGGICYVIDKYCLNSINPKLRKQALAKVYRDLGDEFLFELNFGESKNQYLKALSYKPFSFWPMINFIKASLNLSVNK